MTMVEIMVVAAMGAVLAGASMASMAEITKRQRVTRTLDQVLVDVQQQRVIHVAAGREELLAICVDCIDAEGRPRTPVNLNVVNTYLIDNPETPERGRLAFVGTYDNDLKIDLGISTRIAVDALGRSVTYDTRLPQEVMMNLKVEDVKESVTFTGDGRLDPSFGQQLPQLVPHAQNLSGRLTPDPMPRGGFTGDATRATAMPLH